MKPRRCSSTPYAVAGLKKIAISAFKTRFTNAMYTAIAELVEAIAATGNSDKSAKMLWLWQSVNIQKSVQSSEDVVIVAIFV